MFSNTGKTSEADLFSKYQRKNVGGVKRSYKKSLLPLADAEAKEASCEESKVQANGRWSKKEKQLFIEGLQKFGRDWKKVQVYVGTRTGTQIRSHAQKYFLGTKAPKTRKSATEESSESQTQALAVGKESSPKRSKAEQKAVPKDNRMAIEELREWIKLALRHFKSFPEKLTDLKSELLLIRQKLLEMAEASSELQQFKECLQVVEAELEEAEASLKGGEMSVEAECGYLVRHMANFGFGSLEEVNRKYVKLSDWVKTN